jgi:GntR family transcriptional regulator / MocR family aminotransferase
LKRRSPLLQVPLDRTSRESLHEQLTRHLRAAIDSGEIAPGAPLPSTRAMAAALGVSRNTVITAYEVLAAEGRIVGRAGSATRVFGAVRIPHMPDWRVVLREAQYPVDTVRFRDPDSHALYFHR